MLLLAGSAAIKCRLEWIRLVADDAGGSGRLRFIKNKKESRLYSISHCFQELSVHRFINCRVESVSGSHLTESQPPNGYI